MTESRRALVVGKFWPPHRGHHDLIRSLEARSDECVVLVCATDRQHPSGLDRATWLHQVHPRAEVIVVDDICDDHAPEPCPPACTPRWAKVVNDLGLEPVHLVASCEAYGPRFAEALRADYLALDRSLSTVGGALSATSVRGDLQAHWGDLHPVVRAGLYRRVVVLGAESTGTTTLASDLANHLQAPLVPEIGRTVSWARFTPVGDMEDVVWDEPVFWEILDRQARAESQALLDVIDAAPLAGEPWMVCDTDALATVAWWERYLTEPGSAAARFAQARLADLYLLTDPIGVDFEDQPIRDGQEVRSGMHRRFVELLDASGAAWQLVSGSPRERLAHALDAVSRYEQSSPRFER